MSFKFIVGACETVISIESRLGGLFDSFLVSSKIIYCFQSRPYSDIVLQYSSGLIQIVTALCRKFAYFESGYT